MGPNFHATKGNLGLQSCMQNLQKPSGHSTYVVQGRACTTRHHRLAESSPARAKDAYVRLQPLLKDLLETQLTGTPNTGVPAIASTLLVYALSLP